VRVLWSDVLLKVPLPSNSVKASALFSAAMPSCSGCPPEVSGLCELRQASAAELFGFCEDREPVWVPKQAWRQGDVCFLDPCSFFEHSEKFMFTKSGHFRAPSACWRQHEGELRYLPLCLHAQRVRRRYTWLTRVSTRRLNSTSAPTPQSRTRLAIAIVARAVAQCAGTHDDQFVLTKMPLAAGRLTP